MNKVTLRNIQRLKNIGLEFMDNEYLGKYVKHNIKCIKHKHCQLISIRQIFRVKNYILDCCKFEKLKNTLLKRGFKLLSKQNHQTRKYKHWYIVKCTRHNYTAKLIGVDNIINRGSGLHCCGVDRRSGKNSSTYNPDLTNKERMNGRVIFGLGKWKKIIKKKFDYTCQKCGDKKLYDKRCIAHHLNSYSDNKHLAINNDNGTVMCERCHINFHKKYGFGNNTKRQFEEFVKI